MLSAFLDVKCQFPMLGFIKMLGYRNLNLTLSHTKFSIAAFAKIVALVCDLPN